MRVFHVGIPFLACALFASCTQVKVPEQVANSLKTVQLELAQGRAAIVSTTAALRNLRDNKGADIKPQLAAYNENLTALEDKVGGLQVVGDITREKNAAFFQKWETEINEIQDKNVSAAGQERRKEVMTEYDALKAKIQKLREAYQPYYANLVDVRTALKTDQTAQQAAVARPAMEKAIGQESDVLAKLDDVNRDINKMISK